MFLSAHHAPMVGAGRVTPSLRISPASLAPVQVIYPATCPAHRRPLVVAASTTQQAAPSQSAVQEQHASEALPTQLASIVSRIASAPSTKARLAALIELSSSLPAFPEDQKVVANRVMGCTSQVWVTAQLDFAGRVHFAGTSDSEISRGLVGLLVHGLSGLKPEEVLAVSGDFLPQLGLGASILGPSRSNGAANMLEALKRRTRSLVRDLPRFPSIVISADSLVPQGTFAEVQAQYLNPDAKMVSELANVLREKQIGVVAHFYMDPEVQGVLTSAAESWPHIAISDSLVMADTAVRMAEAGCKAICVLGVDFMSENVRAILDEAGHRDVAVYRMAAADIGCSLAEAAESERYMHYLSEASRTPASLHVVYINTSLKTKALADAALPTITCTSSNVVQTVLQGFAQVPEASVWYGPDTYMGRNLAQLFTQLAECSDEEIKELHPGHNQASIKALLPRLHYYDAGTCIVHHIFGGETCEVVRQAYGDAFLTAHFEVPGEMFTLAMEAKRKRGMGVVGSTQNILDFIAAKVSAALAEPRPERLQFVLGTEAGMITSIVRKVQGLLRKSGRSDVDVEVVFPVNPKSITTRDQATSQGSAQLPGGLAVVPGPAAGEGCSLEGGCAACPYMRMNTLSALMSVCNRVGSPAGEALLEPFKPCAYAELVNGKTMAAAGCRPILHMRHFQKNKAFSDDLVNDMRSRVPSSAAAGQQ